MRWLTLLWRSKASMSQTRTKTFTKMTLSRRKMRLDTLFSRKDFRKDYFELKSLIDCIDRPRSEFYFYLYILCFCSIHNIFKYGNEARRNKHSNVISYFHVFLYLLRMCKGAIKTISRRLFFRFLKVSGIL